MSLALVPRSARALAEHLNRYYRVFRGIDPDSVALRLSPGGSFAVLHSATAAQLLQVTDAGIALPAGAITGAMIADGTITGADIAAATITPDKLTGGSGVPAGAITSVEIADGTIQTGDIAPGAATMSWSAVGVGGSPQAAVPGGPLALMADMSLPVTSIGRPMLFVFEAIISHSQLGHGTTIALFAGASQMADRLYSTQVVGTSFSVTVTHYGLLTAGPQTIEARWSVTGGVATSPGIQRRLTVIEFRR